MLTQPLSEIVAARPSRQIDALTAEVLCMAGERTAMKLISLLGDGATHTADECLAKLGMTAAMLRTTVKRVRRRGFDITTWPRTRFRALSYELVSVPVLMPDRAVA